MIFTRTYRCSSKLPVADIKSRLAGKHFQVHNLDFEVSEKEGMLRIIPHAENEKEIKTLPITHVEFSGNGSNSQLKISSKIRKIDSGGPRLIVIFCAFILIAAVLFLLFGRGEYTSYSYFLFGLCAIIFIPFWLRMEKGYFDYVRKIRDYIKKQCSA
ncbi:MAG: hypothetical protein JST52_05420 [Bacteroidetes bacterium]|nr:hypothetical protein [Bacteroidota bacterium]MBS1740804.1 hypothetical protein [Bacteroidota bacterium]